jgi:hypothetical protein
MLRVGNARTTATDRLDKSALFWKRRKVDLVVEKEVLLHPLSVRVPATRLYTCLQKDRRLKKDVEELSLDLRFVDIEREKVIRYDSAFKFIRHDPERPVPSINATQDELATSHDVLILGANSGTILAATQDDAFVVGADGHLSVACPIPYHHRRLVTGEDIADAFHLGAVLCLDGR